MSLCTGTASRAGYDDSGWFAGRKPGIRRVRNEIKIHARADDQGHRAAIDHGARDARIGVLQVRAVERRRPCLDPCGVDQTRLVDQPRPQRLCLTEPIQRMRRSTVLTMGFDGRDHLGQRLDRGDVAVQHLERLAIVLTDPDLEPRIARGRVGHHSADLKAADLANQHAVIDRRRCPAFGDQRTKLLVLRRRSGKVWQRLSDRRQKGTLDDVPHLDGEAKRRCTAGERAGALLRQDLELLDAGAYRPRQCRTKAALLPIVEKHPADIAVDSRRAEANGVVCRSRLAPWSWASAASFVASKRPRRDSSTIAPRYRLPARRTRGYLRMCFRTPRVVAAEHSAGLDAHGRCPDSPVLAVVSGVVRQ